MRCQQNAATNTTTIQATLAGDVAPDLVITISGLFTLTAANFALTSAQSAANLAGGAALSTTLAARSGSAFEYAYGNVQGKAYSSYTSVMYANAIAADNLNLSASSNQINLYENGATITRGSASESFAIGNGCFTFAFHGAETINVGASGADAFAFGTGFGAETINGFAAAGTNADTLRLSTAAFSYLNSGMTQAQDLAAVMSHATTTSSGVTIADSAGDHLTLAGRHRGDPRRQPGCGEVRLTAPASTLSPAPSRAGGRARRQGPRTLGPSRPPRRRADRPWVRSTSPPFGATLPYVRRGPALAARPRRETERRPDNAERGRRLHGRCARPVRGLARGPLDRARGLVLHDRHAGAGAPADPAAPARRSRGT